MKKWNEPKVWSLGIGSTNEDMIPLNSINQEHYCHGTGNDKCIKSHKDHDAAGVHSHIFTGGNNGGCTWEEHQHDRNACCCYS